MKAQRSGDCKLTKRVAEVIRAAIAETGAVSFARFMELALYHPEHGYYERPGQRLGRAGDYYTNVSVGRLFGELLAFQFARWSAELRAEPLQLVEAGAHDGRLAADILEWLRGQRPGLFAQTEYWILEPSANRRAWQAETLAGCAGVVRWGSGWQAFPPGKVKGIIFANELLDALPVHRLGWDAEQRRWFEWAVTVESDRFVWARLPWSGPATAPTACTAHFPSAAALAWLPDGFTTEISPAAASWWQAAARALAAGRLMTLDYGLDARQFFSPDRADGTLRAYRRHHFASDLLAHPGEQDLTAEVDFTVIQAAGEALGLRTEGRLTQERWLTQIARQTWAAPEQFPQWTPARLRQFQTLTHPEHLGRAFEVLIQVR
jgi:SAM-dependent MidA family methyltransferase